MVIKVLTIAGTDPSGGAGIQADLKTFSALGAYGASVITALVAQNTMGVRAIHTPDCQFLAEQLDAVFEDIQFDAVKIGMLGESNVIDTVAKALKRWQPRYVVVDPVMVAKSGDHLLAKEAVSALIEKIFPLASLITPNLPEAAVLLNRPVAKNEEQMQQTAQALVKLTGSRILLKGGHLTQELTSSPDYLQIGSEVFRLIAPRIKTTAGHGTGCTLSAAIAALMPKYHDWYSAVAEAKNYLYEALRQAESLKVGKGTGPVHHFHAWWPTLS